MPLKTTRQNSEAKLYSSRKEKDIVSQKEGPVETSTNAEREPNLGEEHAQTPPASDEIKELDEKKNEETEGHADVAGTEKYNDIKPKNDTKNNKEGVSKSKKPVANSRERKRGVNKNQNPNEEAPKTKTVDSDLNDKNQKSTVPEKDSNPGEDDNNRGLTGNGFDVSEKSEETQPGTTDQQEHVAETAKEPQISKPKPGLKSRPSKVSRNNFFDNPPLDGRVKHKTHPYERMTHMRGSAQKEGSNLQKQKLKSKMMEKPATVEDDDWAEQLFDDPYRATSVQNGGPEEKEKEEKEENSNTSKNQSATNESKPEAAEQNNPKNQNKDDEKKLKTAEQDKKVEKKSELQKTNPFNKSSSQKSNLHMGRGKPASRIKPGKIGIERPRSRLKTPSKTTDSLAAETSNNSIILRASSSLSQNPEKQGNAEAKEEQNPAETELQVESIEDQSTEDQSNLPEVKQVEPPKTQAKGAKKAPTVDPQRGKPRGSRANRPTASNLNAANKEDPMRRRKKNAAPAPSEGKPAETGKNKPSDAQKSLDEAMKEVKDDEELQDLLPGIPDEKPGAQSENKLSTKRGTDKATQGKKQPNNVTPREDEVKVQAEAENNQDVNAGADDALQKAKDVEDKPEEVSDTELPLNLDDDNGQENAGQKISAKSKEAQKKGQVLSTRGDSIDDLIDASASMNGNSAVARKRKPSYSESFGGAASIPETEDGKISTALEAGSTGDTNDISADDKSDGKTLRNKQGKKGPVKRDKEWLLNKGMAKPVPQSTKVSATRVEKEVGKIRLDGEPNSDEELPPSAEAEDEEGEKVNEDPETQEKNEDKPKLDAYGRPLRTKSAIMRAKEVIDSKEMSESTENLLKALCEDAIDELIRNAESSSREGRVDSPTDTIDFVANENKEDPNKTVKRRKKKDEYIPARYTFATFRNCPCILCTRKKPRKMKILTKSKKKDKTIEEPVEEKEPEEPEPEVEPEPELDPQRQLAQAAAEELLQASEAYPINGQDPIEVNASGMVVQRIIEMSASLPTSQLLWRITDVKSKIQSAKKEVTVTIFSQAFYTAPHGYKLICATCPYGNKQGFGKYLPVYFFVCKGKWDNLLPWPFTPEITVTLLDQNADPEKRQDLVFSFKPDPTDPVLSKSLEQPAKERNTYFGLNKFAPLKCLSPSKFTYVRDDVMFLQVFVRSDKVLVI